MVINLAPYRLFGDLNGDGVEDAAVIPYRSAKNRPKTERKHT
jgi:hypothetical protein